MGVIGAVRELGVKKVGSVQDDTETMPGCPGPTPSQSHYRGSVQRALSLMRGGLRQNRVPPVGISNYSRGWVRKNLLKGRGLLSEN